MASAFERDFLASGSPDLQDQHGITVTYTPFEGVAVSRVGIWQELEGMVQEENPTVVTMRQAQIDIDDNYDGVSLTPQYGDIVVKDGEEWQFLGATLENGIHKIILVRSVINELSHGVKGLFE